MVGSNWSNVRPNLQGRERGVPLNNGQVGDEHFVHCSEVVPSSEVEMYGQCISRGQNSLSIVGRLSTLRSVNYRRFYCSNLEQEAHNFPIKLVVVIHMGSIEC